MIINQQDLYQYTHGQLIVIIVILSLTLHTWFVNSLHFCYIYYHVGVFQTSTIPKWEMLFLEVDILG